jgi:hypothetical protein
MQKQNLRNLFPHLLSDSSAFLLVYKYIIYKFSRQKFIFPTQAGEDEEGVIISSIYKRKSHKFDPSNFRQLHCLGRLFVCNREIKSTGILIKLNPRLLN